MLQKPSGKGNAVRAGLEVATSRYIISMDADGSMDPREIPAFVALLENGYEVVKGSRGAVGGGSTDFTPLRRAGNLGLVSLYNMMFGTRLSDITYGYIGFRRDVLARLGLYADGFEIEVQMVTHAQLAGLSVRRAAEPRGRPAQRREPPQHVQGRPPGAARDAAHPVPAGPRVWRHRASDLPTHRAAVDDVTTVSLTNPASALPSQRQAPGPRAKP